MKINFIFIMCFLAFSSVRSQNNHDKTSLNIDRWLDLVDLQTRITFTEFRYDRFVSNKMFASAKFDTILILNMTILENGKIMKENRDPELNNKLNLYIQDWLYSIVKDSYIHVNGVLWHPTFAELQLVINDKNIGKITNSFFPK